MTIFQNETLIEPGTILSDGSFAELLFMYIGARSLTTDDA